jgi:hypothetical protein
MTTEEEAMASLVRLVTDRDLAVRVLAGRTAPARIEVAR